MRRKNERQTDAADRVVKDDERFQNSHSSMQAQNIVHQRRME
jgi:hypothetical protein